MVIFSFGDSTAVEGVKFSHNRPACNTAVFVFVCQHNS